MQPIYTLVTYCVSCVPVTEKYFSREEAMARLNETISHYSNHYRVTLSGKAGGFPIYHVHRNEFGRSNYRITIETL